jgi:DNA-binding NarL/FixJ family response regulator
MAVAIRVAVIDDHPLFRDALRTRISVIVPDAEFAYEGSSIADALAEHARMPIDCVTLDLDLGDGRSPASVHSPTPPQFVPRCA